MGPAAEGKLGNGVRQSCTYGKPTAFWGDQQRWCEAGKQHAIATTIQHPAADCRR